MMLVIQTRLALRYSNFDNVLGSNPCKSVQRTPSLYSRLIEHLYNALIISQSILDRVLRVRPKLIFVPLKQLDILGIEPLSSWFTSSSSIILE